MEIIIVILLIAIICIAAFAFCSWDVNRTEEKYERQKQERMLKLNNEFNSMDIKGLKVVEKYGDKFLVKVVDESLMDNPKELLRMAEKCNFFFHVDRHQEIVAKCLI